MNKSFLLSIVLHKRQLNNILLHFNHTFESNFPYIITEECDGRTDEETQLFLKYRLFKLQLSHHITIDGNGQQNIELSCVKM